MLDTFTHTPDCIKRKDEPKADVFIGTKDALINAGIVRADQFPMYGKTSVSYYSGVAKTTRGAIDENWLRIELVSDAQCAHEGYERSSWCVKKGVRLDIARERKAADMAALRAEWAERDRREEAEAAAHDRALAPPIIHARVAQIAGHGVLPAGWRVIHGGRHA